jgi:hypothetical protein
MNVFSWIGIIGFGIVITLFGLGAAASDVQAQDVLFLVTDGVLTCLIGAVGALGCMRWIPLLRSEQKSRV